MRACIVRKVKLCGWTSPPSTSSHVHGADTVRACIELIWSQTEKLMRSEIAKFPDGTYESTSYLDDDGVAAMARAGTVAVLLPGAFYFMRETRFPPVAALRAAGVPIAIATDCNPGTSPLTSLLLAMNMAATSFRRRRSASRMSRPLGGVQGPWRGGLTSDRSQRAATGVH